VRIEAMGIPQPIIHGTTIYFSIVVGMSILTLFARCLGLCGCGARKEKHTLTKKRGGGGDATARARPRSRAARDPRCKKDNAQIALVLYALAGFCTWLLWRARGVPSSVLFSRARSTVSIPRRLCSWMHQWHPLLVPIYPDEM
jgi:hypothetical protein